MTAKYCFYIIKAINGRRKDVSRYETCRTREMKVTARKNDIEDGDFVDDTCRSNKKCFLLYQDTL